MDTEESFLSMLKKNDGQVFYILLLYFCHIQQGKGDTMCINSHSNILYLWQLQNKYLERV